MIFCGTRNSAYTRALRKLVGSHSTVMDLGAGLGLHGILAAKLGAKKVILVEPTMAIEVAREVALRNDLANVSCIKSTVEDLELDTTVDIIVSVLTGNFLLTEDLLPSLFHARDRFLAPGGRMIPDKGRMEVVPIHAPDYYQKHISAWLDFPAFCGQHNMPEVDYDTMHRHACNTIFYDDAKTITGSHLATPKSLLELDFSTATLAECDQQLTVLVESDGVCHGWLGWFQICLADEWLSTDGIDSETHWSQVFLPLAEPVELKRGDALEFSLKRPEGGQWSWTTTHKGKRQRQSTFLAQPLRPKDIERQSDQYCPKMSRKGEAVQWLFERLNGQTNITQLAMGLREAFPDLGFNQKTALSFVHNWTDH